MRWLLYRDDPNVSHASRRLKNCCLEFRREIRKVDRDRDTEFLRVILAV